MAISKELVQTAKALRLQKGFSQNFLVDEAALQAIAQAVQTPETDHPIVEIGPGAGFLTKYLLDLGHPLTAIEIDPRMVRHLKQTFNEQFNLIHQDVLKTDLVPLIQPRGVITGNLPYHITGPIIFKVTGELHDLDYPVRQHLDKAVFMVQKEVGERLCAGPGSKAYGQLTIQVQQWFDVQPVCVIPRQGFVPAPKVDSMVVMLQPRSGPRATVSDSVHFSKLVKNSFKHRRKTLLNCLKMAGYGESERLKGLLATIGIDPAQRPETVSIEQFGALSDALAT